MKQDLFYSRNFLSTVQVTDKWGNPLPMFIGRNNVCFVQGTHDQVYQVRVKNMSGGRLTAVLGIDDTNVLTGEKPFTPYGQGMLVSTSYPTVFDGWRQNERVSTEFKFTIFDEETVAKQMGGANEELGKIELHIYQEFFVPPPPPRRVTHGSYNYGEMRGSVNKGGLESFSLGIGDDTEKSTGSVGTGAGEDQISEVTYVTFRRRTYEPADGLIIYPKAPWWLRINGLLDNDGGYDLPGSNRRNFPYIKRI